MNFSAIHLIALLACLLINNANGQNLPFNIVACHRSDPNLNSCALNKARASIQLFAQGDSSAGYPQLDPLKAEEIKTAAFETNADDGIQVVLRNVTIVGLADVDFNKLTINIPTLKFTIEANVNLTLDSWYELGGEFLNIPLEGNGKAYIDLDNIQFTYILDHKIVNIQGVTHLEIISDSLTYGVGNAHFNLQNLFNGNVVLGNAVNALLNSNAQGVIAQLGQPVVNFIRGKFKETAKVLYQQVPYDNLLIP